MRVRPDIEDCAVQGEGHGPPPIELVPLACKKSEPESQNCQKWVGCVAYNLSLEGGTYLSAHPSGVPSWFACLAPKACSQPYPSCTPRRTRSLPLLQLWARPRVLPREYCVCYHGPANPDPWHPESAHHWQQDMVVVWCCQWVWWNTRDTVGQREGPGMWQTTLSQISCSFSCSSDRFNRLDLSPDVIHWRLTTWMQSFKYTGLFPRAKP